MQIANIYDIAVLVILVLFAIRGYQKGLVHQLGAIIAMIIGIIVSVRFTPTLAQSLTAQIPFFTENSTGSSLCSFIVLMAFSTLIVWGIINLVSGIINRLQLEGWNNQMGALLGLLHGVLWVMFLTFLLWVYAVPLEKQSAVATGSADATTPDVAGKKTFILQSKLGPLFTEITMAVVDILPQPKPDSYPLYVRLREYISTNAQTIKDTNPELKDLAPDSKFSTPTSSPSTFVSPGSSSPTAPSPSGLIPVPATSETDSSTTVPLVPSVPSK